MSKTSIAKRYAKALFKVGDLQSSQKILEELKIVTDVCEAPEIKVLLKSPVVANSLKEEIFKAIFKVRLISESLKVFISEVLASGRVAYLHEVTEAFEELINDKNSVLDVTLMFASAPTTELVVEIKQKLAEKFKKNIHEKIAIDPKIIGGFIVDMGHKKIDLSLHSEVQAL